MLNVATNGTYQVVDLIEDVVDVLAAHEAHVGLAHQSAHLPPYLVLADSHHDHECHHVIEQHR